VEAVDQLSKMIGELRDLELGPLFEDAELRRICTDSLRSWGCPSVIARLVIEALSGLVAFCEEGVTTNVSRRLLRIAAATPLVRNLVDRLIAGAKQLSDRA